MHIGLVGLGRMGSNMRTRLRAGGIDVTGFDPGVADSDAQNISELLDALPERKIVWVMVPAGEVTDSVIEDLAPQLSSGDIIIDGGNTRFHDDLRRAESLAPRGIHYIDAGVSGGVWGDELGYGLMVGGDDEPVTTCLPVFDALRPEGPREEGFVHAGPVGAGHYAKMVHNGIEYGLMQAYAEGYEILAARDDLIKDVPAVFRAWQRGTVVRSWLLDLLANALQEDPDFSRIRGYADDSGEGRWTIQEAIDQAVPTPVISAALYARFVSRQEDSPAMKAIAALRNQFGGHAVKPVDE